MYIYIYIYMYIYIYIYIYIQYNTYIVNTLSLRSYVICHNPYVAELQND